LDIQLSTLNFEPFHRTALLFTRHIHLQNITTPKQTERLTRFSENQPYALAVHLFGQLYPTFVSPSFFQLAKLKLPPANDLGKPFMQTLHQTGNASEAGKYILHFLVQPSSHFITSLSFHLSPDNYRDGEGGGEAIITFSKTLAYRGNKPHIILTLFATEKMLTTQNIQNLEAEENHLNFIMNLSPSQYLVFPLIHKNLTNREISKELNLSIPTIKSHKAAIRKIWQHQANS
jgi:hypothetical protein